MFGKLVATVPVAAANLKINQDEGKRKDMKIH